MSTEIDWVKEAHLTYRKLGSLEKTSFEVPFSPMQLSRLFREGGIERNPRGRPAHSLLDRVALVTIFCELKEGVPAAAKILRGVYKSNITDSSAYRIIRNTKEFKPQLFATATVIEREGLSGQTLVLREVEAWEKYGRLVGDWTIPMGRKAGGNETNENALKRLIKLEIFEGKNLNPQDTFDFPYGKEPIGFFAVADCRVGLFVLRLKKNEESLGGFSSRKVTQHHWVRLEEFLSNQAISLRAGAREMIQVYQDFLASSAQFPRSRLYQTELNHKISQIDRL